MGDINFDAAISKRKLRTDKEKSWGIFVDPARRAFLSSASNKAFRIGDGDQGTWPGNTYPPISGSLDFFVGLDLWAFRIELDKAGRERFASCLDDALSGAQLQFAKSFQSLDVFIEEQ